MSRITPRWRGRSLLAASAMLAFLAGPAAAGAMAHQESLYTQTNDPAGNVVQRFDRGARGELSPAGTFATGGAGLATLGGRQGAVDLSGDETTVYAVNAGSNTVSSLRVTHRGLALTGITPSGGVAPISVDEHRGRVYVLNSGDTANVTAYRTRHDGSLSPSPAAPASCRARSAPRRSR